MSRCFPFPPPGYCGTGATYEALIESIKLQKETNNKIKAERRKEKKSKNDRKEKKQKEKRNRDEVKLQKNTNGYSHKMLQKAADSAEAQIKKTKSITEVLEKSDLTEEHGPASNQPSYSSDSAQNSNKQKRDDYISLPDGSSAHGKGKPIKLLLLKKHTGSDSSNFSADAKSKTHLSVQSSSNSDGSLVSSVINNGFCVSSGRENRADTKSNPISEGTKIGRKPSAPGFVKRVPSTGLKMSDVEVLQSTRQQPIISFGRHVPLIDLEHEIPSSSDLSSVEAQELNSARQQEQAPSALNPISNSHGTLNPISNMTTTSSAATIKRSHNEITVSRNDGLRSLKRQKEDSQKVGPTRSEKKLLKKHAKYENLVGSWLAPVFQARLPDGEDWLSGSNTTKSLVSKGEVEACQLVTPWRPCARFLADVDIHAMPYTVPF